MTDEEKIAISRAVTPLIPIEEMQPFVVASRRPKRRRGPPRRLDGYLVAAIAAALSITFYIWAGLAVVLCVLVFGVLLFAAAYGGLSARRESLDRELAPAVCPQCGRPARRSYRGIVEAERRRPICEDDEAMCPAWKHGAHATLP